MSSKIIVSPVNLTFIHIPKTGGTSISYWLDRVEKLHSDTYKLINVYDIDHPSLEQTQRITGMVTPSFAVVRNPWDRMVSFYASAKETSASKQFSHLGHPWFRYDPDYSFEQFLKGYNPITKESLGVPYSPRGWGNKELNLLTPQIRW
jgi:hypothetical protein